MRDGFLETKSESFRIGKRKEKVSLAAMGLANVSSRRHLQEVFFDVESLPNNYQEESVVFRHSLHLGTSLSPAVGEEKMFIINLATLSNDNLKKLVSNCISLDDIFDEYENFG